jgi:hypothetical protein
MGKELFTFCIVAAAADLECARMLSLEWVKRWHPKTKQTAEEMLPMPLSSMGQAPATHYLCAMCGTRAEWDDMQAFIASKSVPVVATLVAPQENSGRFTRENRDQWLSTRGLKVIA